METRLKSNLIKGSKDNNFSLVSNKNLSKIHPLAIGPRAR